MCLTISHSWCTYFLRREVFLINYSADIYQPKFRFPTLHSSDINVLYWQVLSLTGGWSVHDEEEEPLGDEDDDEEDKDKVHISFSHCSKCHFWFISTEQGRYWFLSYFIMLFEPHTGEQVRILQEAVVIQFKVLSQ